MSTQVGRNDKCPCGSGKKYKKCCIDKNMNYLKINEFKLNGFSASSAEPGEELKIAVIEHRISTEPLFYVYAIQIFDLIIKKAREDAGKVIISDRINSLLLIIHKDDTAKIYLNDFEETTTIKATRNIRAGEALFVSDISDIQSVDFPGIDIVPTDRVVYFTRASFIFGLYFNFTEDLERGKLATDLANLKKRLLFEDHLKKCTTEAYGYDAFILTEGKTDVMHLKKALLELGLKPDLALQFDETNESFGDNSLLEACKSYARSPHTQPVICIFDRDNDRIIKELESKTETGKAYQSWGNNVFSLLLPVPQHRKAYNHIFIEMYYTDSVIQQCDSSGKRLYFDNEVKKEVLPGNKIAHYAIPPDAANEFTKRIFDKDAESILNDQGNPCAISKIAFAKNISENTIKGTDFASFDQVFEIIKDIAKNHK